MSAFMVDREHVAYLLDAAMSRAICRQSTMRWYHGGASKSLPAGNFEQAAEVGQMLWDENRKSIEYRYPDCVGHPENMPGPVDESFIYDRHIPDTFKRIDPAQVLKSCDCYEYQACEHPEWGESEAKAFIDSLRAYAWRCFPGYEEAEWGAPVTAEPVKPLGKPRLVNV